MQMVKKKIVNIPTDLAKPVNAYWHSGLQKHVISKSTFMRLTRGWYTIRSGNDEYYREYLRGFIENKDYVLVSKKEFVNITGSAADSNTSVMFTENALRSVYEAANNARLKHVADAMGRLDKERQEKKEPPVIIRKASKQETSVIMKQMISERTEAQALLSLISEILLEPVADIIAKRVAEKLSA